MPLGTNCVMVHNEHHTMSMLIVFLQVVIILVILLKIEIGNIDDIDDNIGWYLVLCKAFWKNIL